MRRDYFSRLSRAARWYLPPAEAAEVLEDYREIVDGRSEEELRQEVGAPRETARRLAQPKAHRRWLAAFGTLTVCLLLPTVDTLTQELSLLLYRLFRVYYLWGGVPATSRLSILLVPLGIVLSLFWLRRGGEKGKALPRGIVPLLVILLLGIAWTWFLTWVTLTEQMAVIDFLFPPHKRVVEQSLALFTAFAGVVGMVGLIKARLGDRRWLAVYILGLAGAGAAIFFWRMMTRMYFDESPGWQIPYWLRLISVTAAGLLGTGVSLC